MLDDIKKYSYSYENEKYMIEKLSQIIQIPSTMQNPELKREVLSVFLNFAKSEGYNVENDVYYGSVLLYGSNKQHLEIGILTHLDVVPVSRGWNYNPFTLTQYDKLLIGRGTLDDKGPAVIALTAMNYFLKNNINLPFSVRLFLGCEEEDGMSDIKNFLLTHSTPDFSFTPDNMFPVCGGENGVASIIITTDIGDDIVSFIGKTIVNSYTSYAKVILKRKPIILAEGSFVPSYIQIDENIIETINTDKVNTKIFDGIKILFEYLYNTDMVTGMSKKALEMVLKLYKNFNNDINITDTYNYISSSDYLFFRCDSAKIENNHLITKYQIKYSASKSFNNIVDYLEAILPSYNSNFKVVNNRDGVFFNSNKIEIAALLNSYEETTGFPSKIYFDDYSTYAKLMPNTVAFGARNQLPHTLLGYGRGNMHQNDEYIEIEEMKIALETYIRAIFKLSEIYSNKNDFEK